jgi:hypothetical protein
MNMQIHPRYWKVTEAKNKFCLEMWRILGSEHPYINSTTESLLKIALATSEAVKTKKRTMPELDEVGKKIYEALLVEEKANDITLNESILILIEAIQGAHAFALRYERHPQDPDKKYDEA